MINRWPLDYVVEVVPEGSKRFSYTTRIANVKERCEGATM